MILFLDKSSVSSRPVICLNFTTVLLSVLTSRLFSLPQLHFFALFICSCRGLPTRTTSLSTSISMRWHWSLDLPGQTPSSSQVFYHQTGLSCRDCAVGQHLYYFLVKEKQNMFVLTFWLVGEFTIYKMTIIDLIIQKKRQEMVHFRLFTFKLCSQTLLARSHQSGKLAGWWTFRWWWWKGGTTDRACRLILNS